MKVIGLTGGIASGKSSVAAMLRAQGVPVIDADQLARDAVAPRSIGLQDIIDRFGQQVVLEDGQLDRKTLGAIVFSDASARAALNAIVHPRVAQLAVERLEALRAAGAPVAVYEVPLLFENGLEGMMDTTVLVAAPEELQLARLMARDGSEEAAARARMAAQMPLEEKRRRAQHVVDNSGSREELARQLRAVRREVTGDDVVFVP